METRGITRISNGTTDPTQDMESQSIEDVSESQESVSCGRTVFFRSGGAPPFTLQVLPSLLTSSSLWSFLSVASLPMITVLVVDASPVAPCCLWCCSMYISNVRGRTSHFVPRLLGTSLPSRLWRVLARATTMIS